MKPPTFAPVYAMFFVRLAEIAHRHDYALCVHGSLTRDMDLVAVPWTDLAAPADVLLEAIADYAGSVMATMFGAGAVIDGPGSKPHGRLAWTISIGNGAVIDLSVMPRQEKRP